MFFFFLGTHIWNLPGVRGKAATNPAVVRVQMMEETFMLAVDEVGLNRC